MVMVSNGYLPCSSFRYCTLICDECKQRSVGSGNIVALDDGRTICKECFQKLAIEAELAGLE